MIQEIINSKEIMDFCRENHIKKLSWFGSALGNDFQPDKSDIDLLVEFEKDKYPSLFQFAGLEIKLSEIIGKKVDLRTKEDLSIYFRDEVVQNSMKICEPGAEYGI